MASVLSASIDVPRLAPGTPPFAVRRFTVAEYRQLAAWGLFAERPRVELLDGYLVEQMPEGPDHRFLVELVRRMLESVLPGVMHCRVTAPIALATSEPEPDISVVRGTMHDYRRRHPQGSDVALAIEVADSSLARDWGLKRSLYAAADIPQYWVFDLVNRVILIGEQPRPDQADYAIQRTIRAGENLTLLLDGQSLASWSWETFFGDAAPPPSP